MEAAAIQAVIRFLLPALLAWLNKQGFAGAAAALALKGADDLATDLHGLTLYDEYPGDPPAITTTSNINSGNNS